MRALRSRLGLLGTLALAGLPAVAAAQRVGEEFQVNTYTPGSQQHEQRAAILATIAASVRAEAVGATR